MINIIKKYDTIITNYKIIAWEIEPESYRLNAIIFFIDNSKLIVKDYLFNERRKYSYHWQDHKNELIIRWDNANHWKDIETFPYHKHEKDKVFPSTIVSLEDALIYIKNNLIAREKKK